MLVKKRKQKTSPEKEVFDDTKEVKQLMNDGKALFDKATTPEEFKEAISLFTKAISKAGSTHIMHLNHIYHMRGHCLVSLGNLTAAEKDFQDAIAISDQKTKVAFYNSLGKCKIQMNEMEPNQQKLEEAAKCFEKAISHSNNMDGEAHFNLGMVYRKLKDDLKALKLFDTAINCLKPSETFQVYIEKGICCREIMQIDNSIANFLKACEIKKDESMAHYQLGINYFLNGNYATALDKLSTAIDLSKNEPHYFNYKALTLSMMGQLELALDLFHEALRLHELKGSPKQERAECWFNAGNTLLNLGKPLEALDSFAQAENCLPDKNLLLKITYAQGRAFESLNDPKCIERFLKCLEAIGNAKDNDLYLAVLFHLGCNQQKHRLVTQAIKSFTTILQEDCRERCVLEERGKAYLKNEDYALALKDFEAVAACSENYPEAYYYKGLAKIYLGDTEAAIENFFLALQLGSKDVSAYNGISLAYLKAGKYEKALCYSNISLEKQPKNEQFLIQRSCIYLELNQYIKGIEDLTLALAVNERNPIVYYRRGLAYYKNKQYRSAIVDLQKSLEYEPGRSIQADIFYHIGIAYSNLSQFASSIEPFSKAINIDPKPKYLHERAKSLLLLDQHLEALTDLNNVIENQPTNAFAYFRRGFAHKALKMYEVAAEDFLKARELAPEDPRLIINKRQIYQTKYRKLSNAGEEM